MIKIKEVTEEKQKQFKAFIEKYGHKFEESQLNNLVNWFGQDILFSDRNESFDALCAYFGLIPDEDNRFNLYTQSIEKVLGLDKNFVILGDGYIPMLGISIAEKQKQIKKGSVTIYDPNIVFDHLDGITLIHDKLLDNTDLSDADALIASRPCMGLSVMERQVRKYPHLDTWISYCTCNFDDVEPEELARIVTRSFCLDGIPAYTKSLDFGGHREFVTYTGRNK